MKEDSHKICNECRERKTMESFSINQYGKNNRILRRPVCIECYSKKKKISPKERREYEILHPRPQIGKSWKCPVCQVDKVREFKNDICLDHNHENGEIRGYLCGSCNASIGKFHEKIESLERAIKWLKGELVE
jgi:hypothetical protein|tara:strand:- start:1035 stop:1433 length:399 start_codon:yes stop_codon:yes gene_type:complete